MEEKQKLVRKNIVITQEQDDMIQKIIEKKKWKTKSFTKVIDLAIDELYNSVFKDYVISRGESRSKTPEERAQAQIEIADFKKKKEEDKLLEIVKKLEGRVTIGAGGGKMVQYYTYDKKNRYQQQLTLEMMTEELVASQYFPSREDVEARQAKGEVNYKVGTWE